MGKILLKAYGKINMTLDILGKREDGYHEIETLFRGIHLYDIISLERQDWGIQLECSDKNLVMDEDNLAYRAALLLKEEYPQIKGVTIRLIKRIPVAAGLAGGSADAATVLIGMNQLFNLDLSKDKLHELACSLGADVPFCLYPLAAVGRGKGEILTPVPEGPTFWLVLVKPPFSLSTKDVYEAFSPAEVPARPNLPAVLEGMKELNYQKIFANMDNVLTNAAFELQPELKKWYGELIKDEAGKVMMTGSGPTLVAFFDNEDRAREFAAKWTHPGCTVLLSRTLSKEELEQRMIFYRTPEESED